MWGNPGHLSEIERIIQENPPSLFELPTADSAESERPELRVFLPQTNKENSTYDGIDWGGERVAEEVRNMLCRPPLDLQTERTLKMLLDT
jgi:hypothetical protein